MSKTSDQPLGFAADDDAPIPYMARTRDYYQAIGYETPYRWAHYTGAPFQPLRKPLARSRIAIVTTAAPFDPGKGDQGPGAKYNGGAKFYRVYDGDTSKTHDVRISHIASRVSEPPAVSGFCGSAFFSILGMASSSTLGRAISPPGGASSATAAHDDHARATQR